MQSNFETNHPYNDPTQTLEMLCRLGLPDNAPRRDARTDFTLRDHVIEYPEFTYGIRRLADAHQRFRSTRKGRGLIFVGQSGSGKSTVVNYYLRQFPHQETDSGRTMPVLRVLTPESPTVKTLAQAFLNAMAVPGADKGTAQEKTERVIRYIHACGVEVIAIDEFQHFFEGVRANRPARAVSDWLKNLLSACDIVVVLVGLPKSILAINDNPQLRRRFASVHYLQPFGYVTAEEQHVFQDVLAGLQGLLPCPCIDLDLPDIAQRMYFASQGLIDYVIKILEGAVCLGGSGPGGKLVLEDFAEAFREEVWKACPDALNPFVQGATLRPLIKPKEPFEGWDDIEKYVLSQDAKALVAQATKRKGGQRV